MCRFPKGHSSETWLTILASRGDSFSELDDKKHSRRRRMINSIITMTSVLESEEYIDNVTRAFFQRMSEFADSKTAVDMGEWLHLWVLAHSVDRMTEMTISSYAFDAVCELFFGHQFGFVNEGRDIGGYMEAVDIILPHPSN